MQLVARFFIPSNSTKPWWFSISRGFVNLSASVLADGVYWMVILHAWTSCHSQWWWMSMCCSLLVRHRLSDVRILIVYWLLHSIVVWWPALKSMASKNLSHQRVSFDISDRASSSASVVLVVTVFCFEVFQSIAPSTRVKTYLCVLQRVSGTLPYEASELALKTFYIIWGRIDLYGILLCVSQVG